MPPRRARDAAIRASGDSGGVLAQRYGLSQAQISRIRAGIPRPLSRREEAEQVRAGAWRAECMEADEWSRWVETNPIEGAQESAIAPRPCTDCPLGFAAEMRAEGRCNGTPGWEPPVDEDEEPSVAGLVRLPPREVEPIQLEEVATERVLAVITGPTVSARTIEEEPVMEAATAAPEPIDVNRTETRIHVLEELRAAALEAQEAIQEHETASVAMAKAEEIHELALRRLGRAQVRVRELFEPAAVMADDLRREVAATTHDRVSVGEAADILVRVASEAEQRHERLLHGDPAVLPGWTELDEVAVAPEAPPVEQPGTPVLTANQLRVIEALTAAGGNFADAGAALGAPVQSVSTALRHIGEKGGIPIELIPLLPAAFAKYRPRGI